MKEEMRGSLGELVMMCGKKYAAKDITDADGIINQEMLRGHVEHCSICKEIRQKLESEAEELMHQYGSGGIRPSHRGDADQTEK